MENFINHLEINNFKSIRHLELSGFNKINLFIGRPNVGKSNLLEALSLYGIPYIGNGKLIDIIRLESPYHIFNELVFHQAFIKINVNNRNRYMHITFNWATGDLIINFEYLKNKAEYTYSFSNDNNFDMISQGTIQGNKIDTNIKPYIFKKNQKLSDNKSTFLNPPFGDNLQYILQLYPTLRQKISSWFKEYGLKLVLEVENNQVKIQRQIDENTVSQLPYSLIADTLQRIIFYKTAIASNQNSVLVFEEPEAHAYPPYISEFTQEVINSETNQFFVATHSPIIVNDFLENAREDLAIFMVDFKDGQTVVKPLSKEEIYEVYKYGVDLFFNNEAYLA